MWKWTDASQQIGILQHKKKFKYTRKVGNRYYYDDQKPTVSFSKEVPDLVKTYMEKEAARLWDIGIPKENQHHSVTKNKDGGYDLEITDKTTGKTMHKNSIKREDIATLNAALSSLNRNSEVVNTEEAKALSGYVDRLSSLSNQKISNLMLNKAVAKKKKVPTYNRQ